MVWLGVAQPARDVPHLSQDRPSALTGNPCLLSNRPDIGSYRGGKRGHSTSKKNGSWLQEFRLLPHGGLSASWPTQIRASGYQLTPNYPHKTAEKQFSRPKPRIVGGLTPLDASIFWLAGAIVFETIILALGIAVAGRPGTQQLAATQEPNSARASTQIAVPTPPTIDQKPVPRSELASAPYAPRATLIKLPPPRAVLVRLPQWRIGEERPMMMPYGLEVSALLKGRLPSTDMLPMSGNSIGDTWVVGDSAWVWVTAPGAGSARWIDP